MKHSITILKTMIRKSCENGWIVDEKMYYNNYYGKYGFQINPSLYLIEEPFLMDSQVAAMNRKHAVRKLSYL